MKERDFKEEAGSGFKKKAKIFFIIAGAIFGAGLIAAISILSGMQSGEEVASSPIGAAIGVGVTCLIAAGVLGFLGYRNLKKSKDANAIESQALAIEKVVLEKENRERLAEEKKQQELMLAEEKRKQELALVSPDFPTTKVFQRGWDNTQVWLNKETKQIQFLLPDQTNNETKVAMKKTKILSIDDLILFDIEEEQMTVEDSEGRASGVVSGIGGSSAMLGTAHGSISNKKSTQTIKLYTLLLKFNDIDFPVIRVPFNNDKTTPESIIETIKMIQQK
ncbi:MAG: phage holin family protein [Bacilli bacterium]|nr:phage holin family protein [Bacilli bacterium]